MTLIIKNHQWKKIQWHNKLSPMSLPKLFLRLLSRTQIRTKRRTRLSMQRLRRSKPMLLPLRSMKEMLTRTPTMTRPKTLMVIKGRKMTQLRTIREI